MGCWEFGVEFRRAEVLWTATLANQTNPYCRSVPQTGLEPCVDGSVMFSVYILKPFLGYKATHGTR